MKYEMFYIFFVYKISTTRQLLQSILVVHIIYGLFCLSDFNLCFAQ